jgi:hypothetical protein
VTEQEALAIVARLTVAWPKTNISEDTTAVWVEHLIPKRADLAAECVRDLEHGLKWFPSLSEFNVEYETKAEYDRTANADGRGLPSPDPVKASPEFVAEIVAEMKEVIEQGRAKLAERRLDWRGVVNKTLKDAG